LGGEENWGKCELGGVAWGEGDVRYGEAGEVGCYLGGWGAGGVDGGEEGGGEGFEDSVGGGDEDAEADGARGGVGHLNVE